MINYFFYFKLDITNYQFSKYLSFQFKEVSFEIIFHKDFQMPFNCHYNYYSKYFLILVSIVCTGYYSPYLFKKYSIIEFYMEILLSQKMLL